MNIQGRPMSFPSTLPTAILDTILGRLALLFLISTAGDLIAARQAAAQMLAGYRPETADELRLAAEIIGFSLHALEALGQAAAPDMPLTKILRLRGCAVSLSRESHKAERRLDQLQKARCAGIPAQPEATIGAAPPATEPSRPQIDKAIALIEATRQAIETAGKSGAQTWTQAYQQRQTAKRIAENLKKNQAAHLAKVNAAASVTQAAAVADRAIFNVTVEAENGLAL
jgi:hypothetical protein